MDSHQINSILLDGRKTLEQGHPEEAVSRYFDPVIARYEKLREGEGAKKRYFSASNPGEALIYATLPAAAGESVAVEVTDPNWSAAYLMKAYALTELHRVDEAQKALEAAIALSPMRSQFKAELAYTYQIQKNCERSIALYAQAASDAEMTSDDSTKTADLTRAWRGQGYCLVELGKWDEAEALYKKCLALDPQDRRAKGELEYVQKNRPR
ncbi:MAG: tetratricopeptide repeat protein [Proteobacteria bacterium]|nr:tetratricopeptide repeat protein [Pseudomonadota bacterium]